MKSYMAIIFNLFKSHYNKTETMRPYNTYHHMHKTVILLILLIFVLGSASTLTAQTSISFSHQEKTLLIERNFPLVAWIQKRPSMVKLLKRTPALAAITQKQKMDLSKALRSSSGSLKALVQSGLLWDSIQIKEVGDALVSLYQQKPERIKKMVRGLKQRHVYARWDAQADTGYLRAAWSNVARGLNYIQRTYFLGGKPTYGRIDGITIDPTTDRIKGRILEVLQQQKEKSGRQLFYQIRLETSLLALALNERDEAVRYLPMEGGENATAFSKVKKTLFKNYTYSCILVPGLGPEKKDVRLTEGGKERCRMALKVFKTGVAPFLLVSGGQVHPIKTPYCEAVEMKRFMVDSLGVAPGLIIIDPHARHTTTNLRNATRIIHLFGMPFDQPVLIVTDTSQSAYINGRMRATSKRDLGYLPYQALKALSPTMTRFVPNIQSLQVNPLDPLDP